jgi:ABC-type glycerol-3-phosphate transport system permease component
LLVGWEASALWGDGAARLGDRYGVGEYNVQMAATILTGAGPLPVYFFCGSLFMRGVAAGVTPAAIAALY